MSDPARAMSKEDAYAELLDLQSGDVIRLEGEGSPAGVSLDGWNGSDAEAGNVAGVVIRYWASGSARIGRPSGGGAPDRLDPRNALALVRLCQWLKDTYNAVELYHLGISGGGVDRSGSPRTDCHGQGRAVDFMGIKAVADDGEEWTLTVNDDWGTVSTKATPGGDWPSDTGSATSYRLDDEDVDPFVRDFWRSVYEFVASEWQDRTDGPDGADTATAIGDRSFIMHPDHPATAPGTAHGREAHKNHLHMQIGVTGTES
ncbi:hypothetical protein [Amycolatopsis sp. GM8]|uniref:hypothetical protein n=1 Tax=Amycolatopsis sp. GM8 TaxID=2896530 RepID=UPI001F1878A6|nr:hypothetical protein [Amycolatopsis sp. GM8]